MSSKKELIEKVLNGFFTKKDNAEIATQIALFIGLGFLEVILVDEIFRCPCVSITSESMTSSTPDNWNLIYSLMFFILPALTLSMLYLLQDSGIWYLCMKCCFRKARESAEVIGGACCCCCEFESDNQQAKSKKLREAIMKAFVIAFIWASLAFIDGNYYACAKTDIPYMDNCSIVRAQEKDKLPFTDKYNMNKGTSQLIGMGMVLCLALLYFIYVCGKRCCRDLEYGKYIIVENYARSKAEVIEEKIKKALEEKLNEEFEILEPQLSDNIMGPCNHSFKEDFIDLRFQVPFKDKPPLEYKNQSTQTEVGATPQFNRIEIPSQPEAGTSPRPRAGTSPQHEAGTSSQPPAGTSPQPQAGAQLQYQNPTTPQAEIKTKNLVKE